MKQNVGFTLIELLAVIVILIIIALISIPFITQKLDDIKKSSFESNTKIILESILYQMAKDEKFDITKINETNITDYVKTQKVNYKSLSIYNMNNEPYIVALGNGKWENFVAQGTFDNVIVENNIVLWLDGKIQHDLIVKGGVKNIWTDLSGNGNNFTLNNFDNNENSGWNYWGLKFDGIDDIVNRKTIVNDKLDLKNKLTLSVWIKPEVVSTSISYLISKNLSGGYANQQYYLTLDNKTTIGFGLNGKQSSTNYSVKENEWSLLTVTWDSKKINYYVNGIHVGTATNEGLLTFKTNFSIGGRSNSTSGLPGIYFFNGTIGLVKVYNRELSENEILKNYNFLKLKYGL